eukprot:Blabericola_migrator_1__3145@NODE_191_length_11624_cov_142_842866_g68_i1_p9_GENE_NODE_191_length_11624_cov_142_842866_g68_i1NODE_191_length_11624_cov_142_842866_g68_i1_p9_ORF_typecomplete_len119_score9_35_NODE_191_length_11624_cov_142_842866_g68_i190089364
MLRLSGLSEQHNLREPARSGVAVPTSHSLCKEPTHPDWVSKKQCLSSIEVGRCHLPRPGDDESIGTYTLRKRPLGTTQFPLAADWSGCQGSLEDNQRCLTPVESCSTLRCSEIPFPNS